MIMDLMPVLAFLFFLGAVLGAVTNVFVDAQCWTPRFRSPWRIWPDEFIERLNASNPAGPGKRNKRKMPSVSNVVPPFSKRWYDFLPIFGWLTLSRVGARLETLPKSERLPGLESRMFWIRPFFVELLAAMGAPMLYVWEVEMQGLLPPGVAPETGAVLVARFAVHVLLFVLLLAASLIDIDDMIIPDVLTVNGTILGLIFALCAPSTLLPVTEIHFEVVMAPQVTGQPPMAGGEIVQRIAPEAVPLNLCSPNSTKTLWSEPNPDPNTRDRIWWLMTGSWWFWCFAMLNRVWYLRLPFKKAAAIFFRKLWRTPSTKWYFLAAIFVPLLVFGSAAVNFKLGGGRVGLVSALVGMAAGMALIWGVRLIGRFVLGREAMGFGDVTLMGMIGAFVGWQSCIVIFFLAPFAGLVLGVINAVSGRGREFPYGPFLCLAAAGLVVFWRPIWNFVTPIFELGWIVVAVMLACLVLLGVLLGLWRWIRDRLLGLKET